MTALAHVPMWLCGDCWDTVCYNWHQLPQASHHKNLTLVSTFYTWVLFIRVTPSGEQETGRQTNTVSEISARDCPPPHRLQKLPYPHRGTESMKPNVWAAAENPIKSYAISNLLHHGKIHTPPSNPKPLKDLFLYSSPRPLPHPYLPWKIFRWKIC